VKETITLLKGDLDWIVMKCLEKDRARRYETANGLAADLKRHLSNEPVTARPPSTAYRLQKAFRRNKLVFSAGAAVAGALLLGIIGSTWQSVRATHASERKPLTRKPTKSTFGSKPKKQNSPPAGQLRCHLAACLSRRRRAIARTTNSGKKRPALADLV